MLRLTVAASAVAAALGQSVPMGTDKQCFEEYKCIFHQTVNNQLYSWDLRPLCRRAGSEYSFGSGGAGNAYWSFNICGLVSYPCIPDTWADPYSHGIAHQYLEGPPNVVTVQGNSGCKGQVTDPVTGQQVCSTQCVMGAHDYPDYELTSGSNVNGGVTVIHTGVPPDAHAPFDCPYDSTVGCSGSRRMTYLFTCDMSNKNPAVVSNLFINETTDCNYVISGNTYAACPQKGDPFDPYRDDPNHSFGFVVLGAALTIFVQITYTFGDARGWWEPIKQRLPAIPGFGGKGGIYGGGSGSYRAVAQPIASAASPYGSTSM